METTIIHLVRHGHVENPTHTLYGRLPGYPLSELGHAMADRLGDFFRGVALAALVSSPLQRAQQTIAPIAAGHPGLKVVDDDRIIESANALEGQSFESVYRVFANPRNWWYLRNPLRPSWGEPYQQVAARMWLAINETAESIPGGQAVLVSHELPIVIARRSAEGRLLVHNPLNRGCRQASVTSLHLVNGTIDRVTYVEPCADLYPARKSRGFHPGSSPPRDHPQYSAYGPTQRLRTLRSLDDGGQQKP